MKFEKKKTEKEWSTEQKTATKNLYFPKLA